MSPITFTSPSSSFPISFTKHDPTMSNNHNWQSTPAPSTTNALAGLGPKPSPQSSRTSTPAATGVFHNKKTAAAADSFSNLISFGRDKQQSNLSLLEQQQQLEAQRRKDAEENRRKMDALFGGDSSSGGAFWDQLGDGKSTNTTASTAATTVNDDGDDILAAFNSTAPVDSRSRFPPPSSQTPDSVVSCARDRFCTGRAIARR